MSRNGLLPISASVEDPRPIKAWTQAIASAAQKARSRRKHWSMDQPLSVLIIFEFPRPKSLTKKTLEHIKRPDLEQLGKAAVLGMKGILLSDPSQIYELVVRKGYNTEIQRPKVEIVLYWKE